MSIVTVTEESNCGWDELKSFHLISCEWREREKAESTIRETAEDLPWVRPNVFIIHSDRFLRHIVDYTQLSPPDLLAYNIQCFDRSTLKNHLGVCQQMKQVDLGKIFSAWELPSRRKVYSSPAIHSQCYSEGDCFPEIMWNWGGCWWDMNKMNLYRGECSNSISPLRFDFISWRPSILTAAASYSESLFHIVVGLVVGTLNVKAAT